MEVKLNNVSYKYNLKTKLECVALNNLNINFKENMINVVISTSGGGKTTLLELIAGLIIPTSGSVDFIKKGKEKILPNVGLVFKNPEDQFFSKNVKKQLEFVIKSFPKNKRLEKIEKALKDVGLDATYLKKDPFKLSKSEMKKLALACILTYNPKVILLDEPTIGLDDKSVFDLIKLMRQLKEKNKTIIMSSRNMDFVLEIADYIYILDKGKLIFEGNKYDVFKSDLLGKMNIKLPKIIQFSKLANSVGMRLDYHDDIKDLMKDIYRCVTK